MEKEGFKISSQQICYTVILITLLLCFSYVLEKFYLENPIWIFVLLLLVFYFCYFIFSDTKIKSKELRERLSVKRNPTFFWKG